MNSVLNMIFSRLKSFSPVNRNGIQTRLEERGGGHLASRPISLSSFVLRCGFISAAWPSRLVCLPRNSVVPVGRKFHFCPAHSALRYFAFFPASPHPPSHSLIPSELRCCWSNVSCLTSFHSYLVVVNSSLSHLRNYESVE